MLSMSSFEHSSSSSSSSTTTTTSSSHCRPNNPLETASLWSQWVFAWAYDDLLRVGATRPLQQEDLPRLSKVDTSAYNRIKIMQKLMMEKNEKKTKTCQNSSSDNNNTSSTKLSRLLLRDYLSTTAQAQVCLCISSACRLGQAMALSLLLQQFVHHTNHNNEEEEEESSRKAAAYLYAAILIACGWIFLLTKQRQFFLTYRHGMQLRVGLTAAVYDKQWRLPSINTTTTTSSGSTTDKNAQPPPPPSEDAHVTNLCSNDVERFVTASVVGLYLWWGPLEALCILCLGCWQLSVAGFATGVLGVLVGMYLLPVQCLWWSRQFAKTRRRVAVATDARVKWVQQAVLGARVVKMNAWEGLMQRRISDERALEMTQIHKSNRLKALNEAAYFCSSLVVAVTCFAVHVATGHTLTVSSVFTTLTMLNILQFTMTKLFPSAVMSLSEAYVSARRIQAFLELPEWNKESTIELLTEDQDVVVSSRQERTKESSSQIVITMENVTCYWTMNKGDSADESNDTTNVLALREISLQFEKSRLYGVIGPVGSGKSALLQALLGELPIASGTMKRHGCCSLSVAYASQDAWILNGTVQENITMGRPHDADWYHQVVSACGLLEDINEQFANGSDTVLGDRGIQCSGGQRARIGLARALYRDADVSLLDDPFSAVDAKVGQWMFQSAIVELGIKRGKCIVLVTHHHHFLKEDSCTMCILMDNGRVGSIGRYEECVQAPNAGPIRLASVMRNDNSGKGESAEHLGEKSNVSLDEEEMLQREDREDSKEDRATGVVKLGTWIGYAKAMGGIWVGCLLLVVFAATQTASLVSMVKVGQWAEYPAHEQDGMSVQGLVFGLTAITVVLAVLRALMTFFFSAKASQRLHDKMTQSILFAKISFFDTNPSGRILNRFSADVGIADEQLPLTIFDFLVGCFMALGGVATACAVLPVILLALPPLIWYFLHVRQIFVSTTRELKRLEGIARSPIYEMMSEASHGVSTVRGNDAVVYFQHKFEAVHDAHTRAVFAFIAASRWFATRLELITLSLLSLASLLAVLFHDQGWFDIDPAVLGLALTLLLQLCGTNFPWIVRQSAEVVNQMISIERIIAFSQLPAEAPTSLPGDSHFSDWPTNASISVLNLTVRYRPHLKPSLSEATFEIKSGERVGVVGRTGSGKSTVVNALFRLLEAEEGRICIGGVDISQLGLHKVRTAMSVIPQFPVLFSACTIRQNLDPFSAFSDDDIRSALVDVQMMDVVDELPLGIHSMVSEGGSNFSVGQRQLLCLARAILRRSSVLVLDEASANVDSNTEAHLKSAVTKRFSSATILSIAHRLETVSDFDRILVLGGGRVVEYGPPQDLLLHS